MATERQIPGGRLINETATRQAQVPGGAFVNETVSAPPPSSSVIPVFANHYRNQGIM